MIPIPTRKEKKRKNNACTMYRHECEPVNPKLIMLPMMQYGALCLFGEVGSGGVTLISFPLRREDGGLFVIKYPSV